MTWPPEVCILEDCEGEHHSRGFCRNHYSYYLKTGVLWVADPRNFPSKPKLCRFEGCYQPRVTRRYCGVHLAAARNPRVERTCTFEGCDRKHKAQGYCAMHYDRLRTHNTAIDPIDKWDLLLDYLECGYSAALIAEKLGMSEDTIRTQCQKHERWDLWRKARTAA